MLIYYARLGIRSLLRSKFMTLLTVLVIATGIGVCMTALTMLQILSSDPIPGSSDRLFHPQLDSADMVGYVPGQEPQKQMTRFDAEALMREARADRQAMMASGSVVVDPGRDGTSPFFRESRHTTSEFFALFDVPFRHGAGWTATDDARGALVAVISSDLNARLFGGRNSVGRTLSINDRQFRIAGVLDRWRVTPQFYDMGVRDLAYQDHVFVPFSTALALELPRTGITNCWGGEVDDATALNAPCAWVQFWVELDSPEKVRAYRAFLNNYSAQQRLSGRYVRPVNTRLRDVNQWLAFNEVVPRDVKLQLWLALGFMVVCLINTVGLLLAKFMRRTQEIGIRQAMGASRLEIFKQYMVESLIVGLAGVVPGLALSALGLWIIHQMPGDYAQVARVNGFTLYGIVGLTLVVGFVAGILPAWRASGVAPAIQLKS